MIGFPGVYEKLHSETETVNSSCCNTLYKVTFSGSKLKRSPLCEDLIIDLWGVVSGYHGYSFSPMWLSITRVCQIIKLIKYCY